MDVKRCALMAVVRGFLCLLCLGVGYALYEDQIGDVDWYVRNACRVELGGGGGGGGQYLDRAYT